MATEGPHAVVDELGFPINPARKPWTVVSDFLFQFGDGGLIFSMMDGLGSVTQAAISLGNYDVVAFEKDRICWTAAQNVISQFLIQQERQEKLLQANSPRVLRYFLCYVTFSSVSGAKTRLEGQTRGL